MRRRDLLTALAVAGRARGQQTKAPRKGRLKQCVTAGVFDPKTPFADQCRLAADLGCAGFDLVQMQDWPVLKKYGLAPTMAPPEASGVTIPNALNAKENHDRLEKSVRAAIDRCAAAGCLNLITFSGNRRGMPDAEGADNCVAFLDRVKAQAEDKGVTLCMELLNSTVNHKDYMCDHTAWGVGVMKRVSSPRVKLLYDIYHLHRVWKAMLCRTITDNFPWIAHFHTGLCRKPGARSTTRRNSITASWRRPSADLEFSGYIARIQGYCRPGGTRKRASGKPSKS